MFENMIKTIGLIFFVLILIYIILRIEEYIERKVFKVKDHDLTNLQKLVLQILDTFSNLK